MSILLRKPRAATYEFGPFRVDAESLQAFRHGAALRIPPKAVEILLALLERPGETVQRATLLHSVWPDTVVEETNLSQYIYLLRKVLTVGGRNIIITVPGRGYRLIEEVRVDGGAPFPKTADTAAAEFRSDTPILTILPFETWGQESETSQVGSGVARSIAQRLVRLRGVSVRPVGSNAYATLTLRGSILERQGRVRTLAELIDNADGSLRWAETLYENLDDWFGLQDRIADRISLLLAPEISAGHALQQSAARRGALDLYLKGRFYWYKRSEQGFQKAIPHFEKALAIDSQFSLAYSGLADCYNLMAYYGPVSPRVMGAKALQSARMAVKLDPNLSEGCVSLARALVDNEWDWKSAEVLFRRALTLNPHYSTAYAWYACLLMVRERRTEAMAQMMRAQELHPNSLSLNRDLGFFYYLEGRYADAVAQLEEAMEMDSTAVVTAVYLVDAYLRVENIRKARALLAPLLSKDARNARLLCELGCVEAAAGNSEAALEIAGRVLRNAKKRYVCPFDLTMLYTAAGDFESAFHWLTVSVSIRPWRLIYAQLDPRLEALRADPRFNEILKPLQFPARDSGELGVEEFA